MLKCGCRTLVFFKGANFLMLHFHFPATDPISSSLAGDVFRGKENPHPSQKA
jgi:hypothetical protein